MRERVSEQGEINSLGISETFSSLSRIYLQIFSLFDDFTGKELQQSSIFSGYSYKISGCNVHIYELQNYVQFCDLVEYDSLVQS